MSVSPAIEVWKRLSKPENKRRKANWIIEYYNQAIGSEFLKWEGGISCHFFPLIISCCFLLLSAMRAFSILLRALPPKQKRMIITTRKTSSTVTHAMMQPSSPATSTHLMNPMSTPSVKAIVRNMMMTARVISLQFMGQQFSGTPAKWGLQAPMPRVYEQVSSFSTESSNSSGVQAWFFISMVIVQILRAYITLYSNCSRPNPLLSHPRHHTAVQTRALSHWQWVGLGRTYMACVCRSVLLRRTPQQQQYIQQAALHMQPHQLSNQTQPARTSNPTKRPHKVVEYIRQYDEQYNHPSVDSHRQDLSQWKRKIQRNKQRKQIFGEHYNYNYKRPNQHKMYRIQETQNTEIERANRILLEKIQSIFKRSMGKRRKQEIEDRDHQIMEEITASRAEKARSNPKGGISNIQGRLEQKLVPQHKGRKSMNQIGELNKNIKVARAEARDSSKRSEQQLNRNLIKLSQIENEHRRRRRVHTDIAQNNTKNIGMVKHEKERAFTSGSSLTPHIVRNQNQTVNFMANKKQTTDISKAPMGSFARQNELAQGGMPKIVLLRTVLILNSTSYTLEMSVENNTYMITAVSHPHSSHSMPAHPCRQIISMPYSDYQTLYKQTLGECHENIVQYLQVENGLIKIKGFESHYMDIFEYGQAVMQANTVVDQHSTDSVNATGIEMVRKIVMANRHEDADNESSSSKRIIVHYSNGSYNGEDLFDRLTVAQSEANKIHGRDADSTPGPIQQASHKREGRTPNSNMIKNCIPTMTQSLLNSNVTSKSRQGKQYFTSNEVNLLILPSSADNADSSNVTTTEMNSIQPQGQETTDEKQKKNVNLETIKSQGNRQLNGTSSQVSPAKSPSAKLQMNTDVLINSKDSNQEGYLAVTDPPRPQMLNEDIEAIVEDN